MKLRLPILLLLAISGPVALAMQAPPALQLRTIHVNPEAQAAQNQAVDARKRLLLVNENVQKAIAKAETDKSPAAQADAANAQQQVASAQNAADDAQKKASSVQSQSVTNQDWKQIQSVLQTYKNRYESSMNHYGVLATTLLLAGILLAAASAIAGFMRKSIAAGIVSILLRVWSAFLGSFRLTSALNITVPCSARAPAYLSNHSCGCIPRPPTITNL